MRPGESGAPGLFSRWPETDRAFLLPARQFAPLPDGAPDRPDWIDGVDFFGTADSFLLDSALPLWTNRS